MALNRKALEQLDTEELTKSLVNPQFSCADCKYLYFQDTGYSNWTVEGCDVDCALGKNKRLPDEMPDDWVYHQFFHHSHDRSDNWVATAVGRCDSYEPSGMQVHLDVDGEHKIEDLASDPDVIEAVYKRTNREMSAALKTQLYRARREREKRKET